MWWLQLKAVGRDGSWLWHAHLNPRLTCPEEKVGRTYTCCREDEGVCSLYKGVRASRTPQPDTAMHWCGLAIALPSRFQNIVMGDTQMFQCGQLAPCCWVGHWAHFGLMAAGLHLLISMVVPMGLDQSTVRNSRNPGKSFSNPIYKSLVLGKLPKSSKIKAKALPEKYKNM